jgi:hypothetical protein
VTEIIFFHIFFVLFIHTGIIKINKLNNNKEILKFLLTDGASGPSEKNGVKRKIAVSEHYEDNAKYLDKINLLSGSGHAFSQSLGVQ